MKPRECLSSLPAITELVHGRARISLSVSVLFQPHQDEQRNSGSETQEAKADVGTGRDPAHDGAWPSQDMSREWLKLWKGHQENRQSSTQSFPSTQYWVVCAETEEVATHGGCGNAQESGGSRV